MRRSNQILALLLAFAPLPSLGGDFVACVVAGLPDNGTYLGAATRTTKLKCEFTNANYFPTLPELYQQGWTLIQVLGAEQAISRGGQGASPLYLLEHKDPPPQAAPASQAAPAGKKK